MKKLIPLMVLALVSTGFAGVDFNAGADLRIRQEVMENVPGLPGGGRTSTAAAGKFANHIRFRPRVWGEVKGILQDESSLRLYVRLTDELRYHAYPEYPRPYAWPGELILDNLFLEGKDLFDGLLDFTVGRQDLLMLYGLDHIFFDGTPGDGSRSTYTDMIRTRIHFTEEKSLDLFALYNFDDCDIRAGTAASKHRSICGLGGAEPDMDDWGFGGIWNDKLTENIPYQLFLMQKNTDTYEHPKYGKRPRTQRTLFGTKLVPRIDQEWSLQLEAMGQVGANGRGDMLTGWSTYSGVNWKSSRAGWKPFGRLGYHFMSGSDDAGKEDGGHGAWDPMWARGATESELFLYGTHYGVGWWSNMHYVKGSLGVDFGKYHKLTGSVGPIFAAAQDGLGGGDGYFKGFQSQVRYDFPLFTNEWRQSIFESESERGLEVFGHLLAEFFNPGDYYESAKPAFFVRWEVTFKF